MAVAGSVGVRGIDTTAYLTTDVERSAQFYNDLFGFEPTLDFRPIGVEWTFPSGETFTIVKPPQAPFEKSGGIHFGVADIKAAVAECQARGIEFEDDAKIFETPGCFMAFAMDPDGNGLILHQLKPGR